MIWKIEFARTAEVMLEDIQDHRIREKIRQRIDGLAKKLFRLHLLEPVRK